MTTPQARCAMMNNTSDRIAFSVYLSYILFDEVNIDTYMYIYVELNFIEKMTILFLFYNSIGIDIVM